MKNAGVNRRESFKLTLKRGTALISCDRKAFTRGLLLVGGFSMAALGRAEALNLYSNNGLNVNLSTTAQYSVAERVNSPSQTLLNAPEFNDGDPNLQHGVVSDEFEVLPILSVTDGNFGLHLSGVAYLNTAYLRKNQNESPNTLNYSVSNNRNFASGTVALDGRNAQLLDAFVYDSVNFGAGDSQSVTLKVGRQTLLWGQTLFFGADGIAGGQAPIDINSAVTLANPQTQQIIRPVGQVVLTYQPTAWLTLQSFYQFQWQPNQFPGVGSYFAGTDFLGSGSSRLIVNEAPFGPVYFSRARDITPSSAQFGFGAKFQLGNYDLGIFGLRFNSKTPEVVTNLGSTRFTGSGLILGTYQLAYQKDIQLYGASISTNVGPVSVAGEISGRIHQSLYSGASPYALGDTLNGDLSAIYISPGLPLLPGGLTAVAEAQANSVLKVTSNKSALIGDRTPEAAALEAIVTPNFYDVLPHLDVTTPIGITWYPTGRSQWDPSMTAGTGTLNLGIVGTYKTVWVASLNYTDYLGSKALDTFGPKQPLADRGYVSFTISRTF